MPSLCFPQLQRIVAILLVLCSVKSLPLDFEVKTLTGRNKAIRMSSLTPRPMSMAALGDDAEAGASPSQPSLGMFLRVVPSEAPAGLTHHTANLQAALRLARAMGRVLILPRWHLDGLHNHGRGIMSDLSMYYNLSVLKPWAQMTNEVLPAVRNVQELSLAFIVRQMPIYQRYQATSKLYPWSRSWPPLLKDHHSAPLIRLASDILANITSRSDLVAVHIRRGDKLSITAAATTPQSVHDAVLRAATISGVILRHVWLATNDEDPLYLDALLSPDLWKSSRFKAFSMRSFKSLSMLSLDDNFAAFCVERVIIAKARVRVSTFKVDSAFYTTSLSNISGWQ